MCANVFSSFLKSISLYAIHEKSVFKPLKSQEDTFDSILLQNFPFFLVVVLVLQHSLFFDGNRATIYSNVIAILVTSFTSSDATSHSTLNFEKKRLNRAKSVKQWQDSVYKLCPLVSWPHLNKTFICTNGKRLTKNMQIYFRQNVHSKRLDAVCVCVCVMKRNGKLCHILWTYLHRNWCIFGYDEQNECAQQQAETKSKECGSFWMMLAMIVIVVAKYAGDK